MQSEWLCLRTAVLCRLKDFKLIPSELKAPRTKSSCVRLSASKPNKRDPAVIVWTDDCDESWFQWVIHVHGVIFAAVCTKRVCWLTSGGDEVQAFCRTTTLHELEACSSGLVATTFWWIVRSVRIRVGSCVPTPLLINSVRSTLRGRNWPQLPTFSSRQVSQWVLSAGGSGPGRDPGSGWHLAAMMKDCSCSCSVICYLVIFFMNHKERNLLVRQLQLFRPSRPAGSESTCLNWTEHLLGINHVQLCGTPRLNIRNSSRITNIQLSCSKLQPGNKLAVRQWWSKNIYCSTSLNTTYYIHETTGWTQ